MGLHHIPLFQRSANMRNIAVERRKSGTLGLAHQPGSLVRSTLREIGADGRIRTRTVQGLSLVPLLVGLRRLVLVVGVAPILDRV